MLKVNFLSFLFAVILISGIFLGIGKAFAQQPQRPVIDSVSIIYKNNAPRVALAWHLLSGEVVDGIVVYRQVFNVPGKLNGTFHGVDTLPGNAIYWEDTSFVYFGAKPLERSVKYRISAFTNDIDNNSELTDSVGTILISRAAYDNCLGRISADWVPYSGWAQAEITEIQIWQANNDGSLNKILYKQTSGNATDFSISTTHTSVQLRIRYMHTLGTVSTSPLHEVNIYQAQLPQTINIDSVVTLSGSKIKISGNYDHTPDVAKVILIKPAPVDIELQQSTSLDGSFSFVNDFSSIQDSFAVAIYNNCPNLLLKSQTLWPLLLNLSTTTPNLLTWNTDGYGNAPDILRLIVTNNGSTDYISLNAEANNYDISPITSSSGSSCFVVEAQNGNTIWKSNNICVTAAGSIRFPNAIAPGGSNENDKYFRPFVNNITTYNLKIYDRTGTLIFETENVNQYWDGTYNGKDLPQGVYMYVAEYAGENKELKKVSGWVAIIR